MNRRGFTFIELVTVWAIIGILAAILFPVFAKAQEKARSASCMSNLQSIGAALKMYAQDHYGHFPPNDNDMWPLVPNCLAERDVFICPSVRERRIIGYPPYPPGELAKSEWLCDYVYRGGLCDDDRPDQVVAADSTVYRHLRGANCLWLSGRCKALYEGSFEHRTESEIERHRREGFLAIEELRKQKGDQRGQEPPEEHGGYTL